MERRRHGREFKLEAVRLVRERGVTVAQAARDLDIHLNLLRTWITAFEADPRDAFAGAAGTSCRWHSVGAACGPRSTCAWPRPLCR
jgi:transposase-like protein